jgi:hypothetical protein
MKVTVSALGAMRKYLPDEKAVDLGAPPPNLIELVSREFGVPPGISRIGFIVNGKLRKQSHVPEAGDKIVFMVLGGAG